LPTLYFASVTVHVLAAMVWLGSMSFLAVVGAPVLQLVEPPELRQHLFNALECVCAGSPGGRLRCWSERAY